MTAITLGHILIAVFAVMAGTVVYCTYKMGYNDGKEDKN